MVTISLCMIVKNEEAVLARCLDSVREIADETVIVDTGSADRTKEIAARYTDRIYDFPWRDDFSAARNFSFAKASMDYCMWLDADDVMRRTEVKKLADWKAQADGSADAVMLKYVTGFDERGKGNFFYYRERLLKRNQRFFWKGRVHEAIAVFGKVEYLPVEVEHRSIKKRYGTRNLDIYERMRAEGETFTPRDRFYYGRELYYHGKYEEAVKNFLIFLDMKGAYVENQVEACRFGAYSCYGLGKEEEALEFLLKGLSFRAPGGELCCDLGKHFYDRERWEEAAFWYEGALRAPERGNNGGFFHEECCGYLPCLQLSVCYDRLGKKELAAVCHRRAGEYKPYGKEFLKNRAYFEGIEGFPAK